MAASARRPTLAPPGTLSQRTDGICSLATGPRPGSSHRGRCVVRYPLELPVVAAMAGGHHQTTIAPASQAPGCVAWSGCLASIARPTRVSSFR